MERVALFRLSATLQRDIDSKSSLKNFGEILNHAVLITFQSFLIFIGDAIRFLHHVTQQHEWEYL